jgi:hypothetical protein
LLFFEKGKVFSRSINLGANSITQDFASESKKKFDDADKIKIEEGFVSLGGAYEEPENQNQAAISKIARQFMTRLHIQVNQTMQFYRGQQGGSAPLRLFLSGGASVMPYTAQFFAEKLNVPVEYFNPFRNVQIDPSVNLEDLSRVAHSLGEVVGLGLRNLAHCPVELNLIPESTRRMQSFNEKKPYLVATVFSLVAIVFVMGFLYQKLADVKKDELEQHVKPILEPLKVKEAAFDRAYQSFTATTNEMGRLAMWMGERYYWGDVLSELRQILMRAETASQAKIGADNGVGVWIEQFHTVLTRADMGYDPSAGVANPNPYASPYSSPYPPQGGNPNDAPVPRPGMGEGENRTPVTQPDGAAVPGADNTGALPTLAPAETNQISTIRIVCRAVDLSSVTPEANPTIISMLETELKASPTFESNGVHVVSNIIPDETTKTFTISFLLTLKNPLKL